MNRRQMRKVATIEARMTSSRFPGKVMKSILGKPLLEWLVDRVRKAQSVDEVIVATTRNAQDDVIESWATKRGVSVYRGSEEDVLLRVLEAATEYGGEIIIELTGDCPLIDPSLIDEAVNRYLSEEIDYVCNVSNKLDTGYPRGLDVQVFSRDLLAHVNNITSDAADHEHVTLYMLERPEQFRLLALEARPELRLPEARLCVDTLEDFALVEEVFKALCPAKPDFGVYDIVSFLKANPELMKLNQRIQQRPARMS